VPEKDKKTLFDKLLQKYRDYEEIHHSDKIREKELA